MPEIAQATITVTPVMAGAQQTITEEMSNAAEPAGKAAGEVLGESMTVAVGDKMSAAGDTLTKGLTAPLAAIGAASVAAWKEVDEGLDTIVTKTGASGDALTEMQGILENITTSIPTDFATAGAAIGEVNTRFALTGQELEDLSKQFIEFADINGQDVSNSVDSVSRVLETFGMTAEDAGSMLDALNVVGQQTGLDVGTVADALSQNAASFQEMGLSAYEAASFLGSASMAGLDTSTAMAGLRKAMQYAAKDGRSLDSVLHQFDATMSSNRSESDKLATAYEIFGSKTGAAIANAVESGTLDLTNFSASLGDFEGSVSTTFEGTKGPMDDFQTTLNELKVIGADLVVAAGPLISGILGPLADGVGAVSDAWKGLSPEMQTAIVTIGGIVAAVGPVMSIGGRVISTVSTISTGLSGLVGTMGSTASGVTSVATASAASAAPVAAASTSFGTFAGQAVKMIAMGAALYIAAQAVGVLVDAAIRITTAGGPAIAVLAGMAVGIGALMGVAAALGPALTAGAVGIGTFGAAMLGIGAGIDLACTGIAKVTEAVGGLVETISDNSEEINSVVENVGETFDGTVTTIADGMATVIDSISGGVSGVLDSVAGIFDSMGDAALNAGTGFEKLSNAVINLTTGTGVLDLGATLTAVAGGVTKINESAAGSDTAATKVKSLTTSFKDNATAVDADTKKITTFGVSMSSAMLAASASIRASNLAGSMASAMSGAYYQAVAGINNLRSLFAGTSFSFYQHIATPHFSMSGSFDAQSGTVPTVSTRWFARAVEYGALFTRPTVIGVGDAPEPELLVGVDALKDAIGGGARITNYFNIDGAKDPKLYAQEFVREMMMQMRMETA